EDSPIEDSVSVFMKKLCTAYSMYFNKRYKRVGKLFEGAFKSSHIDNDKYAKYLFSYIHLNPLKIKDPLWKEKSLRNIENNINFLSQYYWSSFQDYLEKERSENKIITPNDFPDYFSNKFIFSREIFEWLAFNPKVSP
ncbi:MAG: hypothetical protein JW740_03225, partial [Candidatus Zambryskibacteria bacterium]|nr:hypothetical protein [Candidatus Zambryskibacteria bacterium]